VRKKFNFVPNVTFAEVSFQVWANRWEEQTRFTPNAMALLSIVTTTAKAGNNTTKPRFSYRKK